MLAQLTSVIAQSIGMVRITRKEKKAKVFKRVGAQNDDPSPLKTTLPGRIYVFGSVCPTVLIGTDPDNAAMSPQIKITGGQCLRN
jgi:hypothetical protein